MRRVTLCLPYYRNAGMLALQLARLDQLPTAIKSHLELIVVDDGSPEEPAKARKIGMPVKVFRIDVDIRWNQDSARNIAVAHASHGWVLLTDIDHLVPRATFETILNRQLDKWSVYRFNRTTLESLDPWHETPYKPHPNSWLMTRQMYDQVGGYDERFAGFYGTDAEFRDRLSAHARIEILGAALTRVPRETIPDASTTTYLRKQPEDAIGIPRIKAERALIANWKPLRLTFPYHLVSEC